MGKMKFVHLCQVTTIAFGGNQDILCQCLAVVLLSRLLRVTEPVRNILGGESRIA